MTTIRRVLAALLLGTGVVLATSGMLTRAEVTRTSVPGLADTGPVKLRTEARPVHDDQNLRVQCWQEGVKIIDRDGLQGLSISSLTRQDSVGFKRQTEVQPSTFLLPFQDGLCLIQPED